MTRVLGARAQVSCRVADDDDDLAAHHRVRHAVFVAEQGIFPESDRDAHDDDPATLHVLGLVDGEPAGTVRLFPLGGGLWQGDRLAVLTAHRTSGLGGPLVRFAVATAGAAGGVRMIAHIQPPNERFFLRLGWTRIGDVEMYVGHPHLRMEIPLR
ncbi:MSMEG_0567/Sll0786 family nitrogen starvation N-acetyltransferase [Pseudonocardia abyssalis]|uniref:GNAT family N-acetyltransferase n=1 Tax=Pseudonocardia abyssalis TaxID=2792008 RepID=A0ABS6UQA5_9PSEU|nr:MSMEG_0567/Sll0786 family nitrogen starvation N-acetyltransferase [Pseudonocardia abyssalis]MBW0118105.1 GNAT family N-acetyltransferase [Pseudonocardia abyssalis]MBW0134440.1 GNAT family N-acetyltransferase [Pseudonocardia abyssalis]